MRVRQEVRLLPTRVLLVQHRTTVRQVTVRQRLLLQDLHRHIQHRRIQHQRTVLLLGQPLLRTVHHLPAVHRTVLLRDLHHPVRDLDAKQDVIQDGE